MFDMTGMALVGYMLRVARDVVSRNPRFQRALGDVSIVSGNRLSFGNVQIIVRDVSTEPNRLSFDNFLATTTGRAILAQIRDKDGQFIEYMVETDRTQQTPAPGVYYLNVDSVDEGTREVGLTLETYKWYEGRVRNALGTKIGLRDGLDGTTLTVTDPTQSGVALDTQAAIGHIYLLSAVGGLLIKDANGNALTAMTDYWIEGQQTTPLIESTIFGIQNVPLPTNFLTLSIVDQDGYVLRSGKDYTYLGPNLIQLAAWTAAGQTISAQGTIKLDPTVAANLIASENVLPFTLQSGEVLADGQVFVSTQTGTVAVTPNAAGQVVLPTPLPPGGYCNYEARVKVGQSQLTAHKNAVNKDLLPGLRVAIGDKVVVDDQCAIIVSPTITETYRVYGGKPPISFSLECKANDPATADELAKALFVELLHTRKENLEADGLSLTEAGSSLTGGPRDDTGTAGTYSTTLNFSGLADWREFEPLVTRIVNFNVTTDTQTANFGNLALRNRYSCLRATGFVPDYR